MRNSKKGFTPLENSPVDLRKRQGRFLSLTGFTLVEILVVLGVFITLILMIGGVFVAYQGVWQSQKTNLKLVQTVREAMELMCNELRQAGNIDDQPGGIAAGRGVCFGPPASKQCYWRGDAANDSTANGDSRYLYHGQGNNINQAYAVRQQIAGYIVDNPIDLLTNNPYPVFEESAGMLTIWLTVRPNPEQSEGQPYGSGNRNYSLNTQVRPRN